MNKTVLAFFTILCLLPIVFLTGLSFNTRTVKASGTIIIRADGSVEGTTNIVTNDNVTYTLNATINDSIMIERSNIIVDGAGHTVNGPGTALGLGFNLTNMNNVTIKNTQIKQFNHGVYLRNSFNNTVSGNNITNNGFGVYLFDSSHNTVSGNNITNNDYDGVYIDDSFNNTVSGNNITNNRYGVYLTSSSDNNTVSGNNITNNDHGVYLLYSSDNTFSGNNITNNDHGVYIDDSFNNTVSGNVFVGDGLLVRGSFGSVVVDNLVNGKPLVYFEGVSDVVVEDAGQVILVNCNSIKVENLNLSSTSVGVELCRTNSTTLTGNNITNNDYDGVYIDDSFNNTVSGNNITNNYDDGVYLSYSSGNTVSGNKITNNNRYGFYLRYSSGNRFYHNNFINNTDQVYSEFSVNIWDDGYPSGGNYWSDYVDKYPDCSELDGSGLWDTPYVIDGDNQDNYPIIPEFTPTVLLPILIMLSTTAITLAKRKTTTKNKQ